MSIFLSNPCSMESALVLLSEGILSAYPILIKQVDTSVFFQTGLRMAIYTVLGTTAGVITGSAVPIANLWTAEGIATGLLNLFHVGSSYTAFEQLPAGNAMALFYIYPVFNIIGAAAVLGESIPYTSFPWIALAFLGTVLLSQPTPTNWTLIGVICALIAAATETCIYLWFKSKSKDGESDTQPWTKMTQMYGSSGLWWILVAIIGSVLGLLAKNTFRLSLGGLGAIALFNTFVGFVGYALRFYLIPRISTVIFSVLSFFGVITAYSYGWLFQGEIPNYTQIAGAVAIVIANAVLVSKENV